MTNRAFLLATPVAIVALFWGLSFFLMIEHPWLPDGVSRLTMAAPLLGLSAGIFASMGMYRAARALQVREPLLG